MKKKILTILILSFLLPVLNLPEISKSINYQTDEVFIKDGNYFVGLDGSYDNPEKKIFLHSFYMDIHPVTNRAYIRFVKESGYDPKGSFDIKEAEKYPEFPVTNLTFIDCKAFAGFYKRSIPSEWEWEVAARSLKKENIFVYGRPSAKNKGNFLESRIYKKVKVMTYKPNELGIYGMEGNVYEWTSSMYEKKYIIGKLPLKVNLRVLRGGAWTNQSYDVKTTTRTPFPEKRYLDWVGFRCVRYPEKFKTVRQ